MSRIKKLKKKETERMEAACIKLTQRCRTTKIIGWEKIWGTRGGVGTVGVRGIGGDKAQEC